MAMIECPECKKQISEQAQTCVNCGVQITQKQQQMSYQPIQQDRATNGKQPIFKKWWFWVIVAVVVIIIIAASSGGGNSDSAPPTDPASEQPAEEAEPEMSIESLVMNDPRPQSLRVGGLKDTGWVKVSPRAFDENEIEFISEDPEVAIIRPGTKTVGALWYDIIAIGGGETTVYAQTIDGSIKSEEIKVSVSSEDFINSLRFNNGGHRTTSRDTYKDWLVVDPAVYDPDVITFIISDESIATIRKGQSAVVGQWFDVYRVEAGTVEIYAIADNGVESDVLTLTFD